jgi:hypothetical protein
MELATLEFPIRLHNQNYAIISYAGPKTKPKCKEWAIRIYGTFSSLEEANSVAQRAIAKGFDVFDLHIIDIGYGFIPMPPPPDDEIESIVYRDSVLNEIMSRKHTEDVRSNERIQSRLERKEDNRNVEEVFEDMVAKEALALFKEWKLKKKADSRQVIKEKCLARFNGHVEEIMKQTEEPGMKEADTQVVKEFVKAKKEREALEAASYAEGAIQPTVAAEEED